MTKSSHSRRSFVSSSVVWAVGLGIGFRATAEGSPTAVRFLAAGFHVGKGSDRSQKQHFLALRRGLAGKAALTPVSFDVHSVVQNPKHPQSLVAISKEQKSLTYLPDLREPQRQTTVAAANGMMFSGHGVFSPDGRWLILSETSEKTDSGVLTVRDAETLKIVETLPSHGIYPHEMAFRDDGKTLVVANGGFRFEGSNLSFLAFPSGKLLEQHMPPRPGPGCRHFVINDAGSVALGSWNRYDSNAMEFKANAEIMTALRGRREPLRLLDLTQGDFTFKPTRPAIQYLSVGYHLSTNCAVATASMADAVVVLDMSRDAIKDVLNLANPTGVAATDDPNLMVVTDGDGHLHVLDMTTLKWRPELAVTGAQMNGSHLTWLAPVT